MKVLVLTPLYYVKGRDNLPQNTNAVHYLLKYWPNVDDVMVIHEYHVYAKKVKRYISRKERFYLKNGYSFKEDGITINMIELPLLPKQKRLYNFQKKNMALKINEILKHNRFVPDVIVCHQPTCYIGQYVDLIDGCKSRIAVLHITDVQYCYRNQYYWNLITKNFTDVYCRSLKIYDSLKKMGNPSLHDDIVESGVPFYETKTVKNWNGDLLNIIYVGKLIKRKHVDDIIKALSDVSSKRDFRLFIIGSGPERASLESLTKKHKMDNKVLFIGSITRNHVYEYLGKSDIFIMPSTGETLGLVYLEAMRQACIPIGTKGEGIDGIIVDGENGYLVSPRDVLDIRNVLCRLLNSDANQLEQISLNAKRTGDEYDEKSKSLKYYHLICDRFKTDD